MEGYKNIIVFGAGRGGKAFLAYIRDNSKKYNVLAIADNCEEKQNTLLDGVPIISPSEINRYNFDYIVIATAFILQVKDQLINTLGIHEDKIIIAPKSGMNINKSDKAFEDPATKSFARESLINLVKLFNNNKISYFIDHGTLLGIVREGDLLSWDDDIDLSAYVEEFTRILDIIKNDFIDLIKEVEWMVNVNYNKNNEPISIQLSFEDKKAKYNSFIIDIMLIKFVDKKAVQYLTLSPDYYFKRAAYITFFNVNIRIPFDYISYLEHHYGDWKKPKKDMNFLEINNFREPEVVVRKRIF